MILVSAIVTLPSLLSPSSTRDSLVSFLSLCALSTSAYVLTAVPITKPSQTDTTDRRAKAQERQRGPVAAYLEYVNCGLSIVIGLSAFTSRSRFDISSSWLLRLLPFG